jgi:hypothetical protein
MNGQLDEHYLDGRQINRWTDKHLNRWMNGLKKRIGKQTDKKVKS